MLLFYYNPLFRSCGRVLALLLLVVLGSTTTYTQSVIKINEIMAANCSINTDGDGSFEDWIEITNTGNVTIALQGYSLTNKPSEPAQWVFPQANLTPGEFLIIWLSNKNLTTPGLPFHTNFTLDSGGDKIMLFSPSGVLVDSVNTSSSPCDVSFGRNPDGSDNFFYFEDPTPYNSNNNSVGLVERLKSPDFSITSGFFADPFSLTITSVHPDATILYTLDGSEPDPANLSGKTYMYKTKYRQLATDPDGVLLPKEINTYTYTVPINIANRTSEPNDISAITTTWRQSPILPSGNVFKGTVVKAKTFQDGYLPSKTKTRSYFITPEGLSAYTLPVVSLSIDEDQFFDYNVGRYVAGKNFDAWRDTAADAASGTTWCNYSEDGEGSERSANFSFIENGEEVVNQTIGVRIHGNWTRSRPQKGLRLYARDTYEGSSSIKHNFFNNGYDSFKRIILRCSGNDSYNTFFRDAFMQSLVKHLPFPTQDYRPAVSFVNGEYWGITNLRERIDDEYFKRVFDIDDTEIDILQNYGNIVDAGDNGHYTALKQYIYANDLTLQSKFDYLHTQMHIDNYTDFQISEIFFANSDWPENNILFWRKRLPAYDPNAPFGADGRWHWAMYDTDAGYGLFEDSYYNGLASATNPNDGENTLLLRNMLKNEAYKHHFINRFADLINSTFTTERALEMIAQFKAGIEPEMPEHILRWRRPSNMGTWNSEIDTMILFANLRPDIQREHIVQQFNLNGTFNLIVKVAGGISTGFVKVNTINLGPGTVGVANNPYPWEGKYFDEVPITLTAIPQPGYVFSHWSGDSNATTPTITITTSTDKDVTAHFQADPNALPQPIYFFAFDANTPNDAPLQTLAPNFAAPLLDGSITFQSALLGYPFDITSPNWRKASMERRNKPTDINYRQSANGGLDFLAADIKGLQIRQPFTGDAGQNTMVLNLPTTGFKDLLLSFAVIDELAAQNILIDYSTTTTPQWTTAGLASTTFAITQAYQLITVSFVGIDATVNNSNFKVRIRFDGTNMAADEGNRVTFNNFCLDGKLFTTSTSAPALDYNLSLSPNPATQEVNIQSQDDTFEAIRVFNLAGQEVLHTSQFGQKHSHSLRINHLTPGIYVLKVQMTSGKIGILKVVKT